MSALMRPGRARHHEHAVAEIDRLLDAVGDEQHRGLVRRSRSPAARPAASRASARRGRRTARPSAGSSGPSSSARASADALLHAAGNLVRVVLLEAVQPDAVDMALADGAALWRAARRASPGRTRRCPSRCARAAARSSGTRGCGPGRAPHRLALDRDGAGVRSISPATIRSSVVLPQPLGPSRQTNWLLGTDKTDGIEHEDARAAAPWDHRRRLY